LQQREKIPSLNISLPQKEIPNTSSIQITIYEMSTLELYLELKEKCRHIYIYIYIYIYILLPSFDYNLTSAVETPR
jgi:hypothetical protein